MVKSKLTRHQVCDPGFWQGRKDYESQERFFQYVKVLSDDSMKISQDKPHTFALVGFACDEGVKRNLGRLGAKAGPSAIRKSLINLCPHIHNSSIYDAGDIVCEDHDLEASQEQLGLLVAKLLKQNAMPIVLGGGHEVAWGHFLGISSQIKPTERLGIINFDAHYDLRPLIDDKWGSSGSSFMQIAQYCQKNGRVFDYTCVGVQDIANTSKLTKVAKELGVHTLRAEECHFGGLEKLQQAIDEVLQRCDKVYVTLCLDVFAQNFAPGVSAPQAFGLSPQQVIPMLRRLICSPKVISFDIAEMNPYFDTDLKTARLASYLITDVIRTRDCVV